MENMMNDKLFFQLKALGDVVLKDYRDRKGCHWQVGKALNKVREAILQTLPRYERQAISEIIPSIEVKGPSDGPYSVRSDEAFRLFNQLASLFVDQAERPTARVEQVKSNQIGLERVIPITKQVFLVHGHDTTNTLRLRTLLKERYRLDPVILSEKPGKGRTLIEKFEEEATNASFAFALITPDDLVRVQNREYAQARPNVVFEIGWFYGRLGRGRVCILFKEGTVIHSDLEGILRIQFRTSIEEKIVKIENELRAVGLI